MTTPRELGEAGPSLSVPGPGWRSSLARWAALRFRAWRRRAPAQPPEAVFRAARATMRRGRYCVVATPGAGVDVHARLVQPSPPHPESLAVRIGTSRTSRKVRELERTGRATLIYEDAPRDACVVLVGAARVLTAEEARLVPFPPLFHAFFPQGPAQDDFVFIEVVPDRLEVIDFARKVTPEPFGLAPAVLVRQGGRWVAGAA